MLIETKMNESNIRLLFEICVDDVRKSRVLNREPPRVDGTISKMLQYRQKFMVERLTRVLMVCLVEI